MEYEILRYMINNISSILSTNSILLFVFNGITIIFYLRSICLKQYGKSQKEGKT